MKNMKTVQYITEMENKVFFLKALLIAQTIAFVFASAFMR